MSFRKYFTERWFSEKTNKIVGKLTTFLRMNEIHFLNDRNKMNKMGRSCSMNERNEKN